jgi:hypothetical protein
VANYFPPSSVYPKNYDSDYSLFLVFNTAETITTQDNSPWADEISIRPVPPDKDEIWASNGFANIEGELFYYDSVELDTNGKINKLKRCSRNLGGTHTKQNNAGSEVRGYVVAEHHNQIVNAILNIESFVGENFSTDQKTLDWRIRHLQQLSTIFDDFTCPTINFSYETISNDPATGIVIQYSIVVDGIFTSFRLDFGDGEFTTTSLAGTHQYSPNALIDPIVTVSNSKCTIVQSPIERNATSEPTAAPTTSTLLIEVPTIPNFPTFNIPTISEPSNIVTIPPIVFPCLDIGPIGPINIPSIIVVEPPINIPSLITFGPVPNFATKITFSPLPTLPSKITFGPIPTLPQTITFGPLPTFPTEIKFGPLPTFPTEIKFGPLPTFPTEIKFGPIPIFPTQINVGPLPTFPTQINVGPLPTFPTQINVGPLPKFPTEIKFGPLPKIPTEIKFGPLPKIPTEIKFGPLPNIPTEIKFGPLPKIPTEIKFGPLPKIPSKITFGPVNIPRTINVVDNIPPTIALVGGPSSITLVAPAAIPLVSPGPIPLVGPSSIQLVGVPSSISLQCCSSIAVTGIPPSISVNWAPVPVLTCVVTVSCPSSTPSASPFVRNSILDGIPEFDNTVDMQVSDLGIPSEILVKMPEMSDIKIIHDIPAIIRVEAPKIPDIQIIGPKTPLPQEIKIISDNIPSTIELVSKDLPESIKLDVSDLPRAIKLDIPETLPDIKIDASGIPDKIQVVGIPSAIELFGAPSEIKLVLPDKPEVELVYKGAPIDVKINLDVSRLTGEDNGQCVAIVPCKT